MLKGFKEFILRGNLVELAVAFIMAAAFAAVVTATVDLLMSLVLKATGGEAIDFSSWKPGGIPVGAWITALISFVILAAVVYFFIVVPYNKLQARRARGEEPTPPSEEVTLLTEIRDELRARSGGTTPPTTGV
ncbi:MAG TPA: large conductance mechanosensitive channel protein MscL [Nocardioidaceae bacterium]|nr:large conductance mechanosensitive channel protein MscL [Nocardioidaceae bacterium]